MIWIIIICLLALAIFGFFLFLRKLGGGKFPWIQFYTKGRESNFSFGEINLLRKVAVENRLENPTSLFWSLKTLDRSVKGLVLKARAEGKHNDEKHIVFLSKLFDFRKRVELALPKYNIGLKSTRELVPQQRIRITLPDVGVFASQVVDVKRRYLAVAYPRGSALPQGFTWKGKKINVYFWRAEDAGYFFPTTVLDDFSYKNYPILYLNHNENLTRSQKRKDVRVNVNIPAILFPLKKLSSANLPHDKNMGLRARLVNLSESGSAFIVGGRAKVGMAVKLQFTLSGKTVNMSGVVKGVVFDQKRNQSRLHMQAVPPGLEVRNVILSYVYNIFGERKE